MFRFGFCLGLGRRRVAVSHIFPAKVVGSPLCYTEAGSGVDLVVPYGSAVMPERV